jgi:hypothetical protein
MMTINPVRNNCLEADRLDVIVRLHDPKRLAELKRAIFSLMCQDYRPLTINLVTQRFRNGETEAVVSGLQPLLDLDSTVKLNVWNFTAEEPKDARSALLNFGIERSRGRYIAILDYDDVMYHDGYTKLIHELQQSGCSIAFGKVVMKFVDVFQDAIICQRQQNRFKGDGLVDLFIDNFCPIHSFVIDRERVDHETLSFDEKLDKLEDYDFLIRVCAAHLSSFKLRDTIVGEYYAKSDGSNTIMLSSAVRVTQLAAWTRAREAVERRRRSTLVSQEVQAALGLQTFDPRMSVRNLIDGWNAVSDKRSSVNMI